MAGLSNSVAMKGQNVATPIVIAETAMIRLAQHNSPLRFRSGVPRGGKPIGVFFESMFTLKSQSKIAQVIKVSKIRKIGLSLKLCKEYDISFPVIKVPIKESIKGSGAVAIAQNLYRSDKVMPTKQ